MYLFDKTSVMIESLIDKLKKHTKNRPLPMHMPGGKGREDILGLPEPFSFDITEIEGFDNLHRAEGVLKYEMDRAADIYGADESLICVNGSTSALTSAICGAFEKGSKVLVARNCHICIINAIIMRELVPVFLYPDMDEHGIYGGITLEMVKEGLAETPDAAGLILTSPTYEGVVSEVRDIAGYLHDNNKVLIVDEAHGAHFVFSDYFPESAVKGGADLVVNSLHKTLPALTQSALLHINGSLVCRERVRAYWDMLQTTSPSYVIMGSISACFDLLNSEKGKELFSEYAENLKCLREKLSGLDHIGLYGSDDKGKIVLLTNDGRLLYDTLLDKYDIQLEMSGERYALAMTSLADSREDYERLFEACRDIDKTVKPAMGANPQKTVFQKHEQVLLPYEAFEKRFPGGDTVVIDKAEGRICLDNIVIYPPGIPLIVSGERISEEDIYTIKEALKKSYTVLGILKNDNGQFLLNVMTDSDEK